jgi:hypothetical protein
MLVKNISREGPQRVTGMGDQFWFGLGATSVTTTSLSKGIVGRRFNWGRRGK